MFVRFIVLFIAVVVAVGCRAASPFVSEKDMTADLVKMLADFTPYATGIYDADGGYFKGNSAGRNNEDGVRTNADMAMVCAFLATENPAPQLPAGVSQERLRAMALNALRFGYATHKANRLRQTTNKGYWGSTSKKDKQWESSLWTLSLAFAAHFLADDLTDADRSAIYNMIKAECNYELERDIPTGYKGDTKAEENGWEANVLACALGLYPNDPLAPQWFERLREFAVNCYSHPSDAANHSPIDPQRGDATSVADLYRGPCLYPDYTLQNHDYFHTSYQNVVMQELGESHLALALFQGESPKWATKALMHNIQKVMDEVLIWLALPDGELAMPNGNDWSMFLFDQITSYTTAACFLRSPDALLLENLAYKNIKARQATTPDGSWLLRSDIGPRRMGVQAHRVLMTLLMHRMASTANLAPTEWDDLRAKTANARIFPSQNIVRASSPARYSIFSWSDGLKNYTGYFVPNHPDMAKTLVPYKANGTGNLIGWYDVLGRKTDAKALLSGRYSLKSCSYAMNGRLSTNQGALENAFALYSTPGNALIYVDRVSAADSATITAKKGALLAISVDPFTGGKPALVIGASGADYAAVPAQWANVGGAIGVAVAGEGNLMHFSEPANNNSISTAKLYGCYSADTLTFAPGEVVDRRAVAYYSAVTPEATEALSSALVGLAEACPDGWNGAIAADPDSARYLLLANFGGADRCRLSGITTTLGAPVFSVPTLIGPDGASATFTAQPDSCVAEELRVFIEADSAISACLLPGNPAEAVVASATGKPTTATATIVAPGSAPRRLTIAVPAQGAIKIF